MEMSALGDRLAELRQDNQELQKDIADLLHVSAGSISNYERGTHLPTVESLVILADHYNITIDYLMGRTNCRIPVSELNMIFANQTTYGTLIEKLNELPSEKRALILELVNDISVSAFIRRQTHNGEGS